MIFKSIRLLIIFFVYFIVIAKAFPKNFSNDEPSLATRRAEVQKKLQKLFNSAKQPNVEIFLENHAHLYCTTDFPLPQFEPNNAQSKSQVKDSFLAHLKLLMFTHSRPYIQKEELKNHIQTTTTKTLWYETTSNGNNPLVYFELRQTDKSGPYLIQKKFIRKESAYENTKILETTLCYTNNNLISFFEKYEITNQEADSMISELLKQSQITLRAKELLNESEKFKLSDILNLMNEEISPTRVTRYPAKETQATINHLKLKMSD